MQDANVKKTKIRWFDPGGLLIQLHNISEAVTPETSEVLETQVLS